MNLYNNWNEIQFLRKVNYLETKRKDQKTLRSLIVLYKYYLPSFYFVFFFKKDCVSVRQWEPGIPPIPGSTRKIFMKNVKQFDLHANKI